MASAIQELRDSVVALAAAGDIEKAKAALVRLNGAGDSQSVLSALAGFLYLRQHDWRAAMAEFDEVAKLTPYDFVAHFNRGITLMELGAWDNAIDAHRKALKLNMDHAKGWLKLAFCHTAKEQWADALACYERAGGLDQRDPEIMIGMGTFMSLLSQDLAAETLYRNALAANPDAWVAEAAMATVLLRQGKWEDGWKAFEARWKRVPHGAAWDFKPPVMWAGDQSELAGKSVILHCEQGFGDTIQFSRYLGMIAEDAKMVTVVYPPAIGTLLATIPAYQRPNVDGVATLDAGELVANIHTSLMSMPLVYGTTIRNVPHPTSFVVTPRDLGVKIGVCWHGGERKEDPCANVDDRRRSIPLDVFQPIIDATKGQAVSLQWEHLSAAFGVTDWKSTAEIVSGLNLVITVDTAIAHLAASLGVETWMLSRSGGCWRWLSNGETTVWYPLMKIYRQEILSEWRPTVARVVADLEKRIG